VGYGLIADLLRGEYVAGALLGLIVVKGLIWSIALGSGTSGGVLAPLLMMGCALGALEASALPGGDRALWPLVSMAAALAGTMRLPLTSVIFALELTHDFNALPAMLIASVVSYGLNVRVLKHSILTQKVARRGYHITQEYAVDPLERLSVGAVMTTDVVTVPAGLPVRDLVSQYFFSGRPKHSGYPVVDKLGNLLGVITRSDLLEHWITGLIDGSKDGGVLGKGAIIAYDLISRQPITAYPSESCRIAAERMAQMGVKQLPVVSSDHPNQLIGMVTVGDLLKAHQQLFEEETKRERFYGRGPIRPRPRAD
jgi:CBS domain-containing protein